MISAATKATIVNPMTNLAVGLQGGEDVVGSCSDIGASGLAKFIQVLSIPYLKLEGKQFQQ